jgi:hypothetical protein
LRSTLALRVCRPSTPGRQVCQRPKWPRCQRPSVQIRKLLATGDYVSSFTFAGSQQKFQNDTYEKLVRLSARVRAKEAMGTPKEQAAAEIHRELVLPSFYEHASRGDVRTFVSHTVCFSCLIQPPEHALPCGHIICTSCLRLHGRAQLDHHVEISSCPMESPAKRFRSTWKVYLKPPSCGVRVLLTRPNVQQGWCSRHS